MVVLDELRRVGRERVDDATGAFRLASLQIDEALGVHRLAFRLSCCGGVLGVVVAVGDDARHVVHRGGDGRLDARVDSRRVDGKSAPPADAENADPVRINVVAADEVIDRRLKVLGVNVRRGNVARLSRRFARVGRIKRDGQESALCKRLRVEPRRLLLHRSERSRDRNRRKTPSCAFGLVHVRRERDAEAVLERRLAMFDLVRLRERLVPYVGFRQARRSCDQCRHCQFFHHLYSPFELSRWVEKEDTDIIGHSAKNNKYRFYIGSHN